MPCCTSLELPLLLLAGGLLTGIRKWRAPPSVETVPYAVACACGQVAAGARQRVHQVVRCTRCGEELFILPLSHLPPVSPPGARPGSPAAPAPAAGRLRIWALPALAVAFTVLGLVVAYHFLVAPRVPDRSPASPPVDGAEAPADRAARQLAAAREHMSRGHFRLALEALRAARASGGQSWPRARLREGEQLSRQAELLADLSAESLEEILSHAAGAPEKEWEAEFAHRYRGKGVVFDLGVHSNPEGTYTHDWLLRARDENARLNLGDLRLLGRLPVERQPRLLFGARLASVRREPGQGWVVRLEPDSGVLLTNPGAAFACFPFPTEEEDEVRRLLRRQADWAAHEPAPGPE